MHLGVGWSYSHALDYLDESMLMTISSFSSGTLILVPDTLCCIFYMYYICLLAFTLSYFK